MVNGITGSDVLAVAAGGAAGSVLRYMVAQWVVVRFGPTVPWHTLAVNVTGAFLLGLLMALAFERGVLSEPWRLLLGVGLLGGYTTFSTLAFESVELFAEHAPVLGVAYALGSVCAGVLAAWLGLAVGRAV